MVLEQAVLHVTPGREEAFEEAFSGVAGLLAGSPGCHGLRLHRCVETPGRYLLLVEWDSVEAHVAGFRGSPAYEQYRGPLLDFYESPPAVEHYEVRQQH